MNFSPMSFTSTLCAPDPTSAILPRELTLPTADDSARPMGESSLTRFTEDSKLTVAGKSAVEILVTVKEGPIGSLRLLAIYYQSLYHKCNTLNAF